MGYSNQTKGVLASLVTSATAGILYYYATLLYPFSGLDIFGWRMIFTVPFLFLFLHFGGYRHLAGEIVNRVRKRPAFALLLCLSSFLLGFQLWIFLWAPINGKALDVSLGYLLMPLVMVLCGRLIYRDRLSGYQKLAVLFAVLGVSNQVYQVGAISLETLAVAFGFPVYFVLRKTMKTEHLGGLLFDMALTLPAAVWILWQSPLELAVFGEFPKLFVLVPLLGAISSLTIACLATASKLLPLSLFGLLGYVEPVLLVVVSLILGERIALAEAPTYTLVFASVAVLAFGGVRRQPAGPAGPGGPGGPAEPNRPEAEKTAAGQAVAAAEKKSGE